MIPRLYNSLLLRPGDLLPSQEDVRIVGVFNPGAVATDDGVVLLVRVAESPRESEPGYVGLPRWDIEHGCVAIDRLRRDEVTFLDQRVVSINRTGLLRLTSTSHIRVVRIGDGRAVEAVLPGIFRPEDVTEEYGIEDPRITSIANRYYITYVAVSRHGAATALASTLDFRSFERHGIIFPPENKDVVLFPGSIGGQRRALHRPTTANAFSRPEMWLASSPDFRHWGEHRPFLGGRAAWDGGRIGAGAPPIHTEQGWLVIYHGKDRRAGNDGGVYCGGALLLDHDEPQRVIRSLGRILVPETEYERTGFMPDVVFPTGVVAHGKTLLVYYGAADTATAVVEFRLRDILGN